MSYLRNQMPGEEGGASKMTPEVDFWDMECVKISERKQLDDLAYAQKKRDEERGTNDNP